MELAELTKKLCEPFPAEKVQFRAIRTSKDGTKAMAGAYLDKSAVAERLDEVFGVNGWQDHYAIVENGSVICTLSVKIGEEWVDKTDVGSPSKQPDPGDKLKAAFTDSLKRAAAKIGIGRYLSRLPKSWVAYDSQTRQLKEKPSLPAWALPAKGGRTAPASQQATAAPPPETKTNGAEKPTGAALMTEILKYETKLKDQQLCGPGELTQALIAWARKQGQQRPDSIVTWPAELAAKCWDEVRRLKAQWTEEKKKSPAGATSQAGGPDNADYDF